MKKNKFSRYFLLISIGTLITIFTLIVQKSYDNLMKASQEAKSSSLIKPLDPSLNTDILDKIESRPELPPSNP